MPGQRLGGRDRRAGVAGAEHRADRFDLLVVADRRRGGVRVDVVDLDALQVFHGLAHAPHRTLAGGGDHVVPVGGGAVAGDLAVDPRAAGLGVLVFLQHQHTGAAGDDEAVAVHVIGARGTGRGLVVARGHRAHGVEQDGERPIQLFATAREDDVLPAAANDLGGVADAVIRGRAGRGDRIVHAADLEPGRQRGRRGRGHRFGYRERADALRPLLAGDGGGFDDGPSRGTARAHDDAGAVVGDLPLLEAGIADRLIHGDVVPGGAAAVETHGAAIDDALGIDRRGTGYLAAEAVRGLRLGASDPGTGLAQGVQNLPGIVADGRDDAHPADDDTPHDGSCC